MIKAGDIKWAAGLLEGEGAFYINKNTKMPGIRLGMSDKDVVDRLATLFGTHTHGPISPSKGQLGTKVLWAIQVEGTKAAEWMMTLYSILGTRRRAQIKRALDAWKSRPSTRSSLSRLRKRFA